MSDIDKLKPCPCCGSTDILAENDLNQYCDREYWLICGGEDCSFSTDYCATPEDAQREWNTNIAQELRSTIAAQSARIEELEKQVEALKGGSDNG